MTYLLLPGRQITTTRFQEEYLNKILPLDLKALPEILGDAPPGKAADIVFAITSSNKSNSRYNPLPIEIRTLLVYEFARELKESFGVNFHIFGIPHYQPTDRFAENVFKEIAEQSDGQISLTPANTVVFTSTPEIIRIYRQLGFSVLPGEYEPRSGRFLAPVPNMVVQQIGMQELTLDQVDISRSARDVFRCLPSAVNRIVKLFQDPLLTEQGDLTDTRNYSSYTRAMSDIVDLKYQEIKDHLLPGKIIDEGCADGVLIERIVRDFPDSDLVGIDISAEMLARAQEAKRAGAFGEAFVFFKQQNLMSAVSDSQAGSVDTVICNSTLHELWSYGHQEETVREYLQNKYKQLRRGGRIVIRDVVGPDEGDRLVFLWCNSSDGANAAEEQDISLLSTQSRFMCFMRDFKRSGIPLQSHYDPLVGDILFRLPLRDAMEFITKKDYTDNWHSEMQEEFCFWSFDQWRQILLDTGFEIRNGSHAYLNAWRAQNRFHKKVQLFDLALTPLDFPVTNMLLIGEKP